MARIEKTVFISYRRTNLPWALAIYHHLTSQGFDVFFDYNSIKSGDFEQIITQNVKGRAHFVVLLTPSALERCDEPGDWLRREIELAIDQKRNIVPIFFEGFSFSSPSVSKYLTGKLELLKKYNGMTVPAEYFDAAMARLCNDFLNVPLTAILHPMSNTVENAVKIQQVAASKAQKIEQKELTAQEWFEQGLKYYEADNFDEAIRYNTEAIRLQPDYPPAFNNRGLAFRELGNIDSAIKDFNEAIRLRPDYALAYNNRGLALSDKGDRAGAIKDYNEAIRLDPNFAMAYNNRGRASYEKNEFDAAIKDYNEAIRLDPNFAMAYSNRGAARDSKGDLDGAIKDYNEAIHLKPDYALAYNNRGVARKAKGDVDGAIKDYTEAIRLKPDFVLPYGGRGDIWWEKKNYELVIQDYQKYLDLGGTANIKQRIIEARKKRKN